MFRVDNFLVGLAIGSLLPVIFLVGLHTFFSEYLQSNIKEDTIYVLSVMVNFFIFRYYLINLKKDKTGRGILLATFGHAFVYVYLYIIS